MKHAPVVDPAAYNSYCTCGQAHPTVDVSLYSGPDALAVLAADFRSGFPNGSALVVDDANTHAVAGADLVTALTRAGSPPALLTLTGEVEATDKAAEDVARTAEGHDLIISVGAGTINDLGKYASGDRPQGYWCVPTAPSMNGFTSSIAAIKSAGVKLTLPASPPKAIYALPDVIAQAPERMRQSGFCDVLAKSVSDVDWQLDALFFSGYYCGLPTCIVAQAESAYLDHPEGVARGDKDVISALFHGLLSSGIAMTLAGSSAPASGGEHLVSHFLDMRQPITGRVPELHGLQVAAGIIVSAACYQLLAGLDRLPESIDPLALFDEAEASIGPVWGATAPEVARHFNLKRQMLLDLPRPASEKWAQVAALCATVDSPEHYLNLIRRAGFPMTLAELGVSRDEFMLAATRARTIRERFTVLDLAAQAGVLNRAVKHAADLMS